MQSEVSYTQTFPFMVQMQMKRKCYLSRTEPKEFDWNQLNTDIWKKG